jgi:hypothetical protein
MIKKKKKKKKKKSLWLDSRTISTTTLAIEISTPQEIIVNSHHPALFPLDGFCLGVDSKPHSLWGTHACHPMGVLLPFCRGVRIIILGRPPLPHISLRRFA